MSESPLCVVLYQNRDISDLVCGKGAADKAHLEKNWVLKLFVLNNLFHTLPLFWRANCVLIACSFLTFVGYLKLLSE